MPVVQNVARNAQNAGVAHRRGKGPSVDHVNQLFNRAGVDERALPSRSQTRDSEPPPVPPTIQDLVGADTLDNIIPYLGSRDSISDMRWHVISDPNKYALLSMIHQSSC